MINKTKLDLLLANTGDMCLKRRAKAIILNLNPRPSDKILDAGCGDGFYLHLLSRLCSSALTGLDDNPKALVLAEKYVKSSRLKLVAGNVTRMPFPANSFDRIICSEVLEHLPDDVGGLKEFKRLLKPGGLVAITVPSHNYPFWWDPVNWILEHLFKTHFADGFWAGVWNQHIRLYTPGLLIDTINASGLKLLDIQCLTHSGLPFNHYLLNIGYHLRKSLNSAPLSKFSSHPDPHSPYQKFLKFVNRIDQKNDREFPLTASTVGIFALATKP